MKRKKNISVLFTALNIFLCIIIFLVGMVFYAGYLFKDSDSEVISAFGYSFHVANKADEQASVKLHTFITAKKIALTELKSGNLVTVVKKDGTNFSALYYANAVDEPQKPYLFAKGNSTETISLTASQIENVNLHIFHSDFIGKIFQSFSTHKDIYLLTEGLLLFICIISLIIVIAKRESFKVPKNGKATLKKQIQITDLISFDEYVPLETSKFKNQEKK